MVTNLNKKAAELYKTYCETVVENYSQSWSQCLEDKRRHIALASINPAFIATWRAVWDLQDLYIDQFRKKRTASSQQKLASELAKRFEEIGDKEDIGLAIEATAIRRTLTMVQSKEEMVKIMQLDNVRRRVFDEEENFALRDKNLINTLHPKVAHLVMSAT